MARGGINIAKLASWRAEARPDEARCLALFGVGPGTLERIEVGEIELGDEDLGAELAERIGRFLSLLPGEPRTHGGSLNSSPAPSRGGAGDFSSLDALGTSGRAKLSGALYRKAIEKALVRQLRWLPPGMKPHTGDIRRAIAAEVGSCSQADLRGAIERLRYQGKLHWSRLELSGSMMIEDTKGASGTAREASSASSSDDAKRDMVRAPIQCQQPAIARRGRRSGVAHAGNRPVPAPAHESEVQRAVREEADAAHVRRVAARAGCGKVVARAEQPAGVDDLNPIEFIQSALADTPADLIVAINRRHKAAWNRILLLGRATARRPGQALYDVLERGLAALEADIPQQVNDDVGCGAADQRRSRHAA